MTWAGEAKRIRDRVLTLEKNAFVPLSRKRVQKPIPALEAAQQSPLHASQMSVAVTIRAR